MEYLQAVFVGYFPKRTAAATDWLGDARVREIGSVSTCISAGPEDWVQHWQHNDLGFYDTEEIAHQIMAADAWQYDLYAYRLFPFHCIDGRIQPVAIPRGPHVLPGDYDFLGYDLVTKSASDFFECSPLSCNAAARDHVVNEYCLIPERDQAYAALLAICREGSYEPGPYYLFEVYRKRRPDGHRRGSGAPGMGSSLDV